MSYGNNMVIDVAEVIGLFLQRFAQEVQEKEQYRANAQRLESEKAVLQKRIRELEDIALLATREQQSERQTMVSKCRDEYGLGDMHG